MPSLLDLLRGAQDGIRLSLREDDEEKKRREAENRKRSEVAARLVESMKKSGRDLLDPIARTVANFGTNVVGGALRGSRNAPKIPENPTLDDIQNTMNARQKQALLGALRGAVESGGGKTEGGKVLNPATSVMEDLGPSLGLKEGGLASMGVGLVGEIAMPSPGGKAKVGKKAIQELVASAKLLVKDATEESLSGKKLEDVQELLVKLYDTESQIINTTSKAGEATGLTRIRKQIKDAVRRVSTAKRDALDEYPGTFDSISDEFGSVNDPQDMQGLEQVAGGADVVENSVMDAPLPARAKELLSEAEEHFAYAKKDSGNVFEEKNVAAHIAMGQAKTDFANELIENAKSAKDSQDVYRSLTKPPTTPPESAAYKFFNTNLDVAEARYVGRINKQFNTTAGNIVSGDEAKYIVPGFDAIQSANYHEPASGFAKVIARKLLDNTDTAGKPVLIMSGGSGAGKTSTLRAGGIDFNEYALVHDTNLNNFDSAVQKIEEALATGRPVEIQHVYRNGVDAFENGVIPRVATEGRIVPVEAHIDTTVNSRDVLNRLLAKYKNDERVAFAIYDNSRGAGQAAMVDIAELPDMQYTKDTLRDKLYASLTDAQQSGRITDAQLETFLTDPKQIGKLPPTGGEARLKSIAGAKSIDDIARSSGYVNYDARNIRLSMDGVIPGGAKPGQSQGIARELAEDPKAQRIKFKRGDEFGKGIRVPITVKKTIDFPEDIAQTYQAREVLDPLDTTTSEILAEMSWAEAGTRTFRPNGEVIGSSSTFPKWVPSHLRSRELFDGVQSIFPRIPPENNIRQRELYEAMQNEINNRLGINIQITTEGVSKDAGETLVKIVGRRGRMGTDVTFEGQTKVFRERAIGDEAEEFNKKMNKFIINKDADYLKQKEMLYNKNVNTPEVVPGTPIAQRLTVMQELLGDPDIKDIGNFAKQVMNVDRVFRRVFGKHYEMARTAFLDPLDDAKDSMVRFIKTAQTSLRDDVVDKLGITKNSKISAEVQRYGEGIKDYEALVRDLGAKRADDVVEASRWFRAKYDDYIDQINVVRAQLYPGQPEKLIPKRKDYFRHFKELSGLEGIKNMFETPAGIDPSLEGVSAYTRPNSKWQSIFQQRKGKVTKEDAVGGFLEYIEAAGHSLYIDPQIKKMNQLREALINVTANPGVPETYQKLNNFIRFIEFYSTQGLAGKTGLIDRAIMEHIPGGRQGLNWLHFANSRTKASIILGKASSIVAQVFNVPQGIASAGEVASTRASLDMVSHIFGKNEAMDMSKFIRERYRDKLSRSFDQRMIDQPGRFMQWMLEVGDEVSTRYVWAAQYRRALMDKVADPVRYADVTTRNLVGGRGLGEMPLIQREKSFRIIAPFTLEMGNSWLIMKDFMDAKQYTKIAKMLMYNWLFNSAAEQVTGRRIVFDPIDAVWDAFNSEEDRTPKGIAGRLAGEVVSNIPGGAQAAQLALPDAEARETFFGEEDPTRFGTGFGVLGIKDASWGGLARFAAGLAGVKGLAQAETTYKGLQAYSKGEARSRTGLTQFPVSEIVKPVLFGKYSTKTAQAYFNLGLTPLSERQTEAFRSYVKGGADPNKTFYVMHRQKIEDSVETKRKEIEKDPDMSNTEKVTAYNKLVSDQQARLDKLGEALGFSVQAREAMKALEVKIPEKKKLQPTLQLPSMKK